MQTDARARYCAHLYRSGNVAVVIVCHCENVNDRTVGAVVAAGADTIERVTAMCHAGGDCSGCHDTIEAIIETTVAVARRRRSAA